MATTVHQAWRPLIAGALQTTSDILAVRNPWTGETASRVYRATPSDLEHAMAAAAAIAPDCARQSGHERRALLLRIRQGVLARRDELAQWIVREGGKPLKYAEGEVTRALATLQDAAEEAVRLTGEIVPLESSPRGAGHLAMTRRVPLGPVIGISPFNFPLNLMLHKVAPALAAGCPILHKPASTVPTTALVFAEIAHEAGTLPGQLQILPMSSETTAPLIGDPRFHALSFTGSPEVGWGLKARANRQRVMLELGGNAAAIVEPDADLETVLPQCIDAGYAYAGQVCISLQRLFLHDAIYDRAKARFLALVEQIPVGDPADSETVVGPLITPEDASRIVRWIDDAVRGGARLLTGGHLLEQRTASLVAPAVLENVDPETELSCKEAFGPVVILERYLHFEEALERANTSRYGLQASVYTNDLAKALRAWETLEVGGVMINEPPTFRVDSMPYGGVKESGLGREGVRYAMAEFTEPRLCVIKA